MKGSEYFGNGSVCESHFLTIVIPNRFIGEESAVLPPAESRFLADKPDFGMTRGQAVFAPNEPLPTVSRFLVSNL